MKKYLIIFSLLAALGMATKQQSIKLYFIISSRNGDKTIEKVFLIKQNAIKYSQAYKDSHNYSIEEVQIDE